MLMQHTREPEVGDACRVIAINQNVALHIFSSHLNAQKTRRTLFKSACTDGQSWRYRSPRATSANYRGGLVNQFFPPALDGMLTNSSRLISGHVVIKSMIVPCSIHSETIIKACGDCVAPTNGNRFGCLNRFHTTTSRQKSCPALISTSRCRREIR